MRICCVSDTHEMQDRIKIPPSDLLLHAGDITFRGDPNRVREFDDWCSRLISDGIVGKVVCIAGNHDFVFQEKPELGRACLKSIRYLEDSELRIDGFRIYGTPWQPWFYDWAFNLKGEHLLKEKFDLIPEGIDILICHSPPFGILSKNEHGQECGSYSLLEAIERARPRLVVFGHIHEGYGKVERNGILYVNASICTVKYEPLNQPILVEL